MSEYYTYHVAIYSKLIEGRDPMGSIERGSEARVNGMSTGFPAELYSYCQPTYYFSNQPLITEIDPEIDTDITKGGAFVCAPIKVNDTHYSVFARIQARSEGGEVQPGRRYTHCALIFVETYWEPMLMRWAAEMLFTERHGERCWGNPVAEYDEEREALPVPSLLAGFPPDDTPKSGPLAITSDATMPPFNFQGSLRTAISGIEEDLHPYVALSAQIGDLLFLNNYAISGRWLSAGLGIGPAVKGRGKRDFFIRLDMREGEQLNEVELPPFDDFNEAKIRVPPKASDMPPYRYLDWANLHGPAQVGNPYHNLLADSMVWPFQLEYLRQRQSEQTLNVKPEPVSGVAVALANFEAVPTDNYSDRDPMSWPELMLPTPSYLDDYFEDETDETAFHKVFDQFRLALIRPALQQIVRRCRILDLPAGYDTLNLNADYEKLAYGLQTLVEFVASYMVLASPTDLHEVLDDLLTHGPLDSIGMPHASRGGILQVLLSWIIDDIGQNNIADWIEERYRYESRRVPDLRRKGLLSGPYTVHKTNRAEIIALFDWLNKLDDDAIRPADACDLSALAVLALNVAQRICELWGLNAADDAG